MVHGVEEEGMTSEDANNDWADDYIDGTCDHCGEPGRVQMLNDPFTAEINPEDDNPETWWCRACWQQRSDDR